MNVYVCSFLVVGCLLQGCTDQTTARNRCVNMLSAIRAAKDNYQVEHNASDGTPVTAKDLLSYFPPNTPLQMLTNSCPLGGHVAINPLGTSPTCSIHGGMYDGQMPPETGTSHVDVQGGMAGE